MRGKNRNVRPGTIIIIRNTKAWLSVGYTYRYNNIRYTYNPGALATTTKRWRRWLFWRRLSGCDGGSRPIRDRGNAVVSVVKRRKNNKKPRVHEDTSGGGKGSTIRNKRRETKTERIVPKRRHDTKRTTIIGGKYPRDKRALCRMR